MHYTTRKLDIPEHTVSSLNSAVKGLLKSELGIVRVRGEVSDVKKSSAGNMFFTLKDEDSFINVMCVKGMLRFLEHKIVESLDVVITGEVVLFNSGCFIKVSAIVRKGYGNILKTIEERKQKLAKMGLFDTNTKLAVPNSLQITRVGVITSSQGAVLHDIIQRVSNRFPKEILFYESPVQGAAASDFITNGVHALSSLRSERSPDVIIIARGGGSLEDLMPFNCEKLAIAVRYCGVPVISAVGHETDHTILDLVADLRAPTPTAAAEFVTSPTRDEVLYNLQISSRRFEHSYRRCMDSLGASLKSGQSLIDSKVHLSHERLLLANASFSLYSFAATALEFLARFISRTGTSIALEQQTLLQAYVNKVIGAQSSIVEQLGSRLNMFASTFAKQCNMFSFSVAFVAGHISNFAVALSETLQRCDTLFGDFIGAANNNLLLLHSRIQAIASICLGTMLPTLAQFSHERLKKNALFGIKSFEDALVHLEHRLHQASLSSVLGRGFSAVKFGGKRIRSAEEIGDDLVYQVLFKDGSVDVRKP